MHDMLREEDRSIRKVPITTIHRSSPSFQRGGEGGTPAQAPRSFGFLWGLLVILACAVAGFLLATLLEQATVAITLKSQTVQLPAHIVATEGGQGSGVGYTRMLVKSIPPGFIPVQGSLADGQIAVIDPRNLAQAVARQMLSTYQGEDLFFEDPSSITATVATNTPAFGHLLVNLAGTSTLVWRIDTQALAQALAGKKRGDFESIIKTFGQGIVAARLSMHPVWKATLPQDLSKIVITTAVAPAQ